MLSNIYEKSNKLIFTTNYESTQYAINELINLNCGIDNLKDFKEISPGISIINVKNNYQEVLNKIKLNPPIFIRHICPVLSEQNLNNKSEDIDIINNNIKLLFEEYDFLKEFKISIKIRALKTKKNFSFTSTDLFNKIDKTVNNYINTNNVEAIDLYINYDEEKLYIGICKQEDCIYKNIGGQYHYSKDNSLSRAEFKLLEVIEILNLDFSKYKKALDLGAAPGGWTKVLLENNLYVEAVDPAMLHESLYKNPKVTHIKSLAQEYLSSDKKYDIIVNDMRMDVIESCKIINLCDVNLAQNGIIIMTLKLPNKGIQKLTKSALILLSKKYNILFARQLFHNRNEVTVVLSLKNYNINSLLID